jgi:BirA family transcriptional regulator, biotin operon repressor / biotin---[acetyl-CoA-carboxylase] ligase
VSRELPGRAGPALGAPRVHLRRTDSTNDRARELAIAGAPHGTLVTASEQTAGRGRNGRHWSAPAGSSLLMSLLLAGHPDGRPSPATVAARATAPPQLLPLIAAVAVCDVAGESARIKWPNDIVIERGQGLAKLAGILAEGRPQHGWAVLGVGLNVAVDPTQLPEELRSTAATLGLPAVEIEPMLKRLLAALERRLGEGQQAILDAWRARDALRGRQISWGSEGLGGPVKRGEAQGIDGAGRLIVSLAPGQRVALEAGEVHLEPLG